MGKSKRGEREYSKEQKLVHENRQLKKQISALRKQLSRIDIDRYDNLKDVIEQHYQEDKADEGRELMEKIKQEWKCHECHSGYLEILKYNKGLDTWYYRKCTKCPHRTPGKRFKEDVQGVFKEPEDSNS